MEFDFKAFAFIIAVAAVINGLGIVRILTSLAEYLRTRNNLDISHYWVFNFWVAFQFLLHVLMWWTMWGIQSAEVFTFLHYLYLLLGPTFLYLGTSLLLPNVDDSSIDIRRHYFAIRSPYFLVAALLWLWAILQVPIFTGEFSSSAPIWVGYLFIAVILRFTTAPIIHGALVILSWLIILFYIATFALNLGMAPAA